MGHLARDQGLVPDLILSSTAVRARKTAKAFARAARCTDRGQLEQAIVNLVVNARDAMPDGGRLEIATRRVEHDAPGVGDGQTVAVDPGSYVVVSVTDDGKGIDPELVEHVIEPFYTTKPEGEGTGLGLAIARRLARSWGGDLRARNHEDGGAVFTLLLPVVEPGSDDSSPATGAGERRRPSGSLVGSGPAP